MNIEPPPPYSEQDESSPCAPLQERETLKPIASGPTEYPKNEYLAFLVYFHMFAQFLIKIGMAFGFLWVGCGGCGRRKTCIYCPLEIILSIFNAFNFWEYSYMKHEQHLECEHRSLENNGLGFFVCDCLILALIGISSICVSSYYPYTWEVLFWPSVILILFDFVILWVVKGNDVRAYCPNNPDSEFVLDQRHEDIFLSEKYLTIKESGPFRIIAQNCSQNPLTGKFVIERGIVSSWYTKYGEKKIEENKVEISFVLPKPLLPGETLTLIPGTHREEGSYSIPGFRSFGQDKGEEVHTTFCNELGQCIVKLTEKFKKDRFLAQQITLRDLESEESQKRDEYGSINRK